MGAPYWPALRLVALATRVPSYAVLRGGLIFHANGMHATFPQSFFAAERHSDDQGTQYAHRAAIYTQMPKLEPNEDRGEGEREGEREQEPQEQPPQLQVQHNRVKLWRRVALCVTFTLLPFTLLFIGCVTLGAYTTDKVRRVNSDEWSVRISNTEALKVSDITNNELHWYSGNICIERVSTNDYQNQVHVSLVRIMCSDVKQRRTSENITRHFYVTNYHLLSFFWTASTEVLLQMAISLSRNKRTTQYLSVYVIQTIDQRIECDAHTRPDEYLHSWQFNYNGTSSVNTNCTVNENVTAACSSPVYRIDRTDRYVVCMFQSTMDGSGHHNVTYSLLINGSGYDLSDTAPYENKECRLDETNCCANYGSVFQEMYEPICVFIHNTAPTSSQEANELTFPMKIKSQKKWDAVIVCWLLAFFVALPLVFSFVCIIVRVRYHRAHPDKYCAELKIAGRVCLRM